MRHRGTLRQAAAGRSWWRRYDWDRLAEGSEESGMLAWRIVGSSSSFATVATGRRAICREGKAMRIVHLTASTFYGGPERQMSVRSVTPDHQTAFLSFAEGGRCHRSSASVRSKGLKPSRPEGRYALFWRRGREIDEQTAAGDGRAVCHGYKANLLGGKPLGGGACRSWPSREGWTGECLKVRVYERLDRLIYAGWIMSSASRRPRRKRCARRGVADEGAGDSQRR